MDRRMLTVAGPVLRGLREKGNATQAEVAERADVSPATVSRLETGHSWPGDQAGDRLIDVYCLLSGLHRLELVEIVVREWEDEVARSTEAT
jgi:DNA-binding XRE family transcriptional regulator